MSTFRRLLGFLRPYRSSVVWSFSLAAGAMVATVLIPFLTGKAIDVIGSHSRHAIRSHSRHELTIWVIAIGVAGIGRLVLSVFRRLIAGRVSLAVELDLRNGLYAQLQRLELSFFDRVS
jgi:ABC-type multidrug transport system fused ATPase/permease subunit